MIYSGGSISRLRGVVGWGNCGIASLRSLRDRRPPRSQPPAAVPGSWWHMSRPIRVSPAHSVVAIARGRVTLFLSRPATTLVFSTSCAATV